MALEEAGAVMGIPIESVRDIHAIAEALIATLDEQMILRGITEGNVAIDAAVNCLCYAMKGSDPRLEEDELLRRVAKYWDAMKLDGAPGSSSSSSNDPGDDEGGRR